jgi:DNA adenine methylase
MDLKRNRDMKSTHRTFVGMICCYGGRFFNGFRGVGDFTMKRRGLLKTAALLKDVDFKCACYSELHPHGAVVYCDPPYRACRGSFAAFDHDKFWGVMREWSKDNKVFISETVAPDDFTCIWQKQIRTQINNNDGVARYRTEKLFVHI